MDKKISGFGYVYASHHVYVEILETLQGKQYLSLDGTKSRLVDDIFLFEGESYLYWKLLGEIEKEKAAIV